MKSNCRCLFPVIIICIILCISCSQEIVDTECLYKPKVDMVDDSIDSTVTTRSSICHVSSEGGFLSLSHLIVRCKFTQIHSHSTALGCEATAKSGSYGWYSVDMWGLTNAYVVVQKNNTLMSRSTVVGGVSIVQAGTPNRPANVDWNAIKGNYKILGPQGLNDDADTTCSFSLSGPYLSSDYVTIYWSVRQYDWYPIGKGTVVSGQNSPSVNIFFPFDREYGCTGIVQARIEPKANPSAGFVVEHKLVIR